MELRPNENDKSELVLDKETDIQAAYCAIHGLISWLKVNGWTEEGFRSSIRNNRQRNSLRKKMDKVYKNMEHGRLNIETQPMVIDQSLDLRLLADVVRALVYPIGCLR